MDLILPRNPYKSLGRKPWAAGECVYCEGVGCVWKSSDRRGGSGGWYKGETHSSTCWHQRSQIAFGVTVLIGKWLGTWLLWPLDFKCLAIELGNISLQKISMAALLFEVFLALKYSDQLPCFSLGGNSSSSVFKSSFFLKKGRENERKEWTKMRVFCFVVMCSTLFFSNIKYIIENKYHMISPLTGT